MKSTVGRPRILTDEQVARILEWHEDRAAWRAMGAKLKSLRQLARDLGASESTIRQVISRRGRYKKPSPARSGELEKRQGPVPRVRVRG